MSERAGRFVKQERGPKGYSAFIPAPLPPDPSIALVGQTAQLHEAAAHALGRLGGASTLLDPERLLYMYVRKEAVLSSQIEGTQSTLSDLLRFEMAEAPGTPVGDVRQVSRYVDALFFALDQIQSGAIPLSLRLLRATHERLLSEGRGSSRDPGGFRRSQNWIGGTRPGNASYVPPPPQEVMPALDNLERYLHDEFGPTPALIKAAVSHAQFETIHPFLDGNGRVGRLLISLLLVVDGVLPNPFFYISLYFKEKRSDYYDALQRVREKGDWEGWLRFFLIGVESVASDAAAAAEALFHLSVGDRKKVAELGRAAPSALKAFDLLQSRILVSNTSLVEDSGMTWPTAQAALERLETLGIAREITGLKRDRLYVYGKQLEILDRGLGEPAITGIPRIDPPTKAEREKILGYGEDGV
jgi:Fic family protein